MVRRPGKKEPVMTVDIPAKPRGFTLDSFCPNMRVTAHGCDGTVEKIKANRIWVRFDVSGCVQPVEPRDISAII